MIQRRLVKCVQPALGAVDDLKFVRSSKCPKPKPERERSCDKNTCIKRNKRRVGHRQPKNRRICNI